MWILGLEMTSAATLTSLAPLHGVISILSHYLAMSSDSWNYHNGLELSIPSGKGHLDQEKQGPLLRPSPAADWPWTPDCFLAQFPLTTVLWQSCMRLKQGHEHPVVLQSGTHCRKHSQTFGSARVFRQHLSILLSFWFPSYPPPPPPSPLYHHQHCYHCLYFTSPHLSLHLLPFFSHVQHMHWANLSSSPGYYCWMSILPVSGRILLLDACPAYIWTNLIAGCLSCLYLDQSTVALGSHQAISLGLESGPWTPAVPIAKFLHKFSCL